MTSDQNRVPQVRAPHEWVHVRGVEVSSLRPGIAIDALLADLIDYAGLYPPAGLDMNTAVRNYLQYKAGPHQSFVGRFVVNLDRIGELRAAAAESFTEIPLSVIVASSTDFGALAESLGDAFDRVSFECKVAEPADIERIAAQLPAHSECYFEIPMGSNSEPLLDALVIHGARPKLRMGGVTSEAFPPVGTIAEMLQALAHRHLAFKCTAGLHHPIRSQNPLTYEPDSTEAVMHGFLNLLFAATLLHFGGSTLEAQHILNEADRHAWQVTPEEIRCRAVLWSGDQLRAVRQHFFISFGSCSFEEPVRGLEALGWL